MMSLMASFGAVLFPTRCLGLDLGLNWVSFWRGGPFYSSLESKLPVITFTLFWNIACMVKTKTFTG